MKNSMGKIGVNGFKGSLGKAVPALFIAFVNAVCTQAITKHVCFVRELAIDQEY